MRQKPHGLGPPTARFKPKSPDHGRHIYAYRHVQTNQVLYSLTRTLDGIRSLRQLPDIGANTPQATGRIRRDLWRPLWSVTFPHSEYGVAQGQHAFRHLREWRRLHELYWKQPASLSQPMSKEKKEELKKRLETRQVNKKETVFDLIKKEKKKMKREIIMDQKANSIADLAAVLDAQEWLGIKTEERHARVRLQERVKEVREMLRLAVDASNNGVRKLEQEIAGLQPYIDRQEGFRLEDGKMGQRQAQRKSFELKWKLEKMRIAAAAFDSLPQKCEQLRRLDDIEAQVESGLARLTEGDQSARLDGELESLREAKALVRQGSSLEPLSKAMETEATIRDSRSNETSESPLSKREAEELQSKLDGYEVALNPASIFPKLQEATSDSIDPGASDLPAILKDINDKRSGMRVDKLRKWATGKDGGVNAKVQRLQHDKEVCERMMPAYSQAKSEMKYEGGEEKVKWWIEDAKAKLAAAPGEEASQQRKERAGGLVEGYEKALQALKEAEGAQPTADISISDAETWLEDLKQQESTLTKWYKSRVGREIKDAERGVPDMTDTASAQSAIPILETKFLHAWIAMQKWAVKRSVGRLKRTEWDKLTPQQQKRIEDSDKRLEELERQEAAIKGDGLEQILDEIQDDTGAIKQASAEIEDELSHETPGTFDFVQVLGAKMEIYRAALATAERVDIDNIIPEITLPTSLQEKVDEWSELRRPDYTSLSGPNFLNLLPSFPPIPTPDPILYRNQTHPVTIAFKGAQNPYSEPIFTLQGVRVKWHNILDAEFAPSWPAEVVHEPMGLVTYTAPEADAVEEPVLSVTDWRSKRMERFLEKKRGQERVVEGLAEAVVRAVKEGRGTEEKRRLSFESAPVVVKTKGERKAKIVGEEV